MFVGARSSVLVAVCVVVAGGMAGVVAPAQAQERLAATVTAVVDGDTLDAQVTGGPALQVQVIGIDAPEPGDCGGDEATAYIRQLALRRNVTLVSDPTLEQFESPGNRPLFYVDRDDRRDVGLEMVRAGWADIWFLSDFQRSPVYLPSGAEAERFRYGVWGRCDGDFHLNRAKELRQRRRSAVAFVRRYYRRISDNRFGAAWKMLSRRVRRDFGPFRSWKVGYRRSLRTTVPFARARLSGRRAGVSVRLRARDRDACTGRVAQQRFRGKWTLAPRRDSWVGVKVGMRMTGGRRPRLSTSECPTGGSGRACPGSGRPLGRVGFYYGDLSVRNMACRRARTILAGRRIRYTGRLLVPGWRCSQIGTYSDGAIFRCTRDRRAMRFAAGG